MLFEKLRNEESHRRAVARITNVIVLVVIVALGAGGYVFWNAHQGKKERERLAQMAEREKAERELFEQRQRQEKARQEEERRQRVEREERERQERQKRDELQQAERQRLEQQRQEEKAARLKAESEVREARETYRQVIQSFRTGQLGFLNGLAETNRPGKAVGEFAYLLPFQDKDDLVVTLARSTAEGLTEVYDLATDGSRLPREAAGFLASLQDRDYLVAAGDDVRFHSKRRKQHVGTIGKSEPAVLADEFFGDVAPEVRRLNPAFEELSFEVVFMPAGAKKPIIVKTVDYGMGYTMEEVREAVCEAFPQKSKVGGASPRQKLKKYKRTVMFWDGGLIKQGIDGVTYVPRVAPASTIQRGFTRIWGYTDNEMRLYEKRRTRAQQNLKRYNALVEEASRQDREEAEFMAEQERQQQNRQKEKTDAAAVAYAAKIDKILQDGQMFFRARISEVKD